MSSNKIVFIDVDGTLISYQRVMPKSAALAVNLARGNGHKMILCTGRSKAQLIPTIWNIGFNGFILGNGAYVEYQDDIIYHKTIPKNDYKNIVSFLCSHHIGYYLETNEGLFISNSFERLGNVAFQKYAKFCGNENWEKITIYDSLKGIKKACPLNPKVNRISYVLNEKEDFEMIKAAFPHLNHGVWGGVSVNPIFGYISEPSISKGDAIRSLLRYTKIPLENSISFGDSNIDISMFENTGYSICMGNGTEEAKKRADYVTDNLEDDGLFKAFKYLELI